MRPSFGNLALLCVVVVLLWQFTATPSGDSAPEPQLPNSRSSTPPTSQATASPNQGDAASQRTPIPATTRSGGELAVRICRGSNLPVSGVKVLRNQEVLGITDETGVIAERLPPGSYTVTVDERTLPDGLLPPPLQSRPRPTHSVPEGFFAPLVEVLDGKRSEAIIQLLSSSQVFGVVVDTAGQPIAGCPVRLQARKASLYALSLDATTTETGLFTLGGVPPGEYLLRVYSEQASPLPVSPSAAPVRLDVAEGSRVNLSSIICGDKRARVVGRVIDQDGNPVSDVGVVAYPKDPTQDPSEISLGLADVLATVKTDESGHFHLAVPPIGIVVQVHPEGSLLPFENAKRLRRYIDPVAVQARVGENNIGSLRAELSRPFTLSVTIRTNEDAIRAVDPHLKSIKPPEVFIAPAETMNDESRWTRLPLVGAAVRYVCDTPSPTMLLVVRRKGFQPLVRRVDPTPGTTSWEILYP